MLLFPRTFWKMLINILSHVTMAVYAKIVAVLHEILKLVS